MSLLTILTSSYNSDLYLKSFLNSVKNQTFKDFELCFEHISPKKDEIKLIKSKKFINLNINYNLEKNLISLPKAWNRMIQRSSSEYICIWNVDDIRTKNSLELMISLLDSNELIDFVYGNYYIVKKFNKFKGKYINESGRESELKSSMILGPFFMFRRKVLQNINMFDEQLISGADYDFAMRLARNYKGMHLDSNLGYYLNSGKGLSTSKSSLQELERTVVELRYKLDVINTDLIYEARKKYDIENLVINNLKVKIKQIDNF